MLGWSIIGWAIALVWALKKDEILVKMEKNESESISVNNISISDEINKLNVLREKGILTDEEFNVQKKNLLEKNTI